MYTCTIMNSKFKKGDIVVYRPAYAKMFNKQSKYLILDFFETRTNELGFEIKCEPEYKILIIKDSIITTRHVTLIDKFYISIEALK